MRSPIDGVAQVAFRAGRWPVQTLAAMAVAVFVLFVAVVELKVGALPTPLTRRFVVSSDSHLEPLASFDGTHSDLPRFDAAKIALPTDAPAAVRATIRNGLAGAEALDDALTHVVLPSAQFGRVLQDLRMFDVDGETWELHSSPSWLAYFRFYCARTAELMRDASWGDLAVVSTGWLGMYYTFFRVYRQFRSLGSRTYLFIATLFSSGLAFAAAYVLTIVLGVNVPKVSLVQGLPFFVLVIGFNNKVELMRESMHLLLSHAPQAQIGAADAVREAVRTQFPGILRETLLEMACISLAGWATKLPGLSEFATLASLVLGLDLVFLVTFFAANVSLKLAMVRVERNDAVRRTLQEDGVAKDVADAYADEVLRSSANARAAKYTHFRWLGGSARLITAFLFLGANLMQVVDFPVSLSMNRADFAPVALSEYDLRRLPMPCVLKLDPALRFSRSSRWSIVVGQAAKFLHSVHAARGAIAMLVLSIAFNGYLVSLVMRQESAVVQSRVPVVVEVPVSRGSDAAARRHLRTGSTNSIGSVRNGKGLHDGSSGSAFATDDAGSALIVSAGSDSDGSSKRTLEETIAIMKAGHAPSLTNEELIELGTTGHLPLYALEKQLKDTTRAVQIRRAAVSRLSRTQTLEASELPWQDYNYDRVLGACCENVVGYLPLPLGVAGPVVIDGEEFYLPMATTEGVLVASTMRGCKALNAGGGVTTEIIGDGMTRGPCVTFGTAARAAKCKLFLDSDEGLRAMERAFNSTSRFARLTSLKTAQAGVFLYIRFRAQTGDAMGMNMISKGTEHALQALAEDFGFDDMTIVTVSGNYCTDKKAAAVNWIEGRGKSVVAEGMVPRDVVERVLKTSVDELVEMNMAKNLVGSAVAGALGGFNAHAANLVAALFLATGQDPAQVVEGSNCITLMSNVEGDLQISVTMPSLEVGTIGGGTILEPQSAMLNMLGVRGPHLTTPGENARKLARIVATAVLAGELSLNSALAAGHLVKSHMAHNRAKPAASA